MLTRDQRLSEQYHWGNTKTSEIHWGTSAIHNFSRGASNYQYTLGRQKIQTLFIRNWFCRPHFHRGTFWGGFSLGTEAGCIHANINKDANFFQSNNNTSSKNLWLILSGSFLFLKVWFNKSDNITLRLFYFYLFICCFIYTSTLKSQIICSFKKF